MLKTVLILFLSYTTVGLCNNGFFSILPFLSEEFAISRVQIGYYSAFYFTSAALLALFSGNIVDRFGPKRSILWGMGCMGLTLFCYGWSTSYQLILFLAIFAGLGMSILTPSVVKGTSIIAPPEKQALFLGLVQAGYSVGSIIAPAILPVLALNFSWQISIQITAVLTLLIGLLTYIFYQEHKVKLNKNNISETTGTLEQVKQINNGLSFKESFLSIFINKRLFFICILGIAFGIAEGSTCSHFTIFLTRDIGLNKIVTGLGFAILFIGGVAGMAGLGWISDSFFKKNRQSFLFLMGLFAGTIFLIFSIFFYNLQVHPFFIIINTFFLGSVSIGWPGAYFALVGELAGEKQAGMATGLSLFFIRTGLLLAPIGFGFIADLNASYQYSWFFFGILIILISSLFLYRK
ncbi:MAG TPA: MFS transporter [Atribacterota bacterium]|nr:MFS transporter [Atribacterota bacterium]